MQYYHRTSLAPADVIDEADRRFGTHLETVEQGDRIRRFRGGIGAVTIEIKPDGGHYTLINALTDQVGESELDKLVKRFLGTIHHRVDPSHRLRGAY